MAKTSAKKVVSEEVKAAPKKMAPKKPISPADAIEKACIDILAKLRLLNIEHQLQSDIEWCLGSYSHDKNPVGLYEMGERALNILQLELAKKTKGVTSKFITDLEKAVRV